MTSSTHGSGFRIRRFVSLLVTVGFVVMLVSGVVLFLTPKGRIAKDTDWQMLSLDKDEWIAMHLTSTVLFLAASLFHVFFNWGPLVRYLRNRTQGGFRLSLELVAAILIGALFVVGTLTEIPPFGSLASAREEIKHGDETECGEEGSGGGGGRHGRGGGRGEAAGSSEGASEEGRGEHGRGGGRGEAAGSSEGASEEGRGEHGGGGGGGRGLGRLTLADLCEREGIPLDTALSRLAREEVTAEGSERIRGLADRVGVSPHELLEWISED